MIVQHSWKKLVDSGNSCVISSKLFSIVITTLLKYLKKIIQFCLLFCHFKNYFLEFPTVSKRRPTQSSENLGQVSIAQAMSAQRRWQQHTTPRRDVKPTDVEPQQLCLVFSVNSLVALSSQKGNKGEKRKGFQCLAANHMVKALWLVNCI